MKAEEEYQRLQPAGKMRANLRLVRKFESTIEIQDGTAFRSQKLGLGREARLDQEKSEEAKKRLKDRSFLPEKKGRHLNKRLYSLGSIHHQEQAETPK